MLHVHSPLLSFYRIRMPRSLSPHCPIPPHKKRTLGAAMAKKRRRLAQKRLPLLLVTRHGHPLQQHIDARKVCLARPRHTKEEDAARGGTE